MKNIAIINAIELRPPASRSLADGASAFQKATSFARRLPGASSLVILSSVAAEKLPPAGPDTPRDFRVIARESWNVADLLAEMDASSEGFEDVFYFSADCPFLDLALTEKMHGNHRRYWADYTFADGFPYGLTPEVLRVDTVKRLRAMAGADTRAPDRETLFSIIRKDINSFDIETELAPTDMRLLRASLCADTERNFLLVKRIAEKGGHESQSVLRILRDEPRILRTLPAFFPVQIVERCPYACSYCPYPVFAGDVVKKTGLMDLEKFALLMKKIAAFAGDAVIDVSLWGEPALHPRIIELMSCVLSEPGLSLVVETSGIGWDPQALSRMKSTFASRLTWIVSLDASSEEVYRKLRGAGHAEAVRTAELLLAEFPPSTWVQAVRMKENEEDLEVFYKFWKTKTENIIIQKYDSFGGMLPDRKVADLSPVKRFPCWHLKRDMAVLIDGTVPLCREDVRREHALGNAFTDDLAAIWDRGEAAYRQHLAATYPQICVGCDEYYTYNF